MRWRRSVLLLAMVLLAGSTRAQIMALGTENSLDVATWNIEWFGNSSNGPTDDDRQVSNVADIIAGSAIDIWALQEIADTRRFDELLALLGSDWQGLLATDSGQQRIAYVFDTRTARVIFSTHILQSSSSAFAGRPPLKAEFRVTLPDTSFDVTLINVHMKAFSDSESYQRRVDAARRVKTHIDFTSLNSKEVLFLGDFNDELEQSTYASQPSPYKPFLDDPEDYTAVTLPIEQAGEATFIGGSGGGTIDHILATDEMTSLYIPSSVRRMSNLLTVGGFAARTSDHVPVMASFASRRTVAVEDEFVPGEVYVGLPWPNPARGNVSFRLQAPGGSVRFEITDVLGRVRLSQTIRHAGGPSTQTLDISGFAAGTYWLRIGIEGRVLFEPVIVL